MAVENHGDMVVKTDDDVVIQYTGDKPYLLIELDYSKDEDDPTISFTTENIISDDDKVQDLKLVLLQLIQSL